MRVDVVGAGRLGRTLDVLLRRSGWQVALLHRGQPASADRVVLCVPEAAIPEVVGLLPADAVAVHTSGAADLSAFGGRAASGSFHPLMTFPGPEWGIPDLRGVPAAVDGDDPALAFTDELAYTLGMATIRVPGSRALYHAGAVLGGNAMTLLLEQARRAFLAAGVAPDDAVRLVRPLALRSIEQSGPEPLRTLTGPMARSESDVLDRHDQALRAAGLHDTADLLRQLRVLAAKQLAEIKS